MIAKNRIVFLFVFLILQTFFIFLYLKQERKYLFEYRAFISSNKTVSLERTFNEALSIIYIDIANNIKFENNNVEVLGNMSKKLTEIDWHKKWFGPNQSLFFSINQNNKNLNSNLENDLSSNISKTLEKLKINYSNKINKLNKLIQVINLEELEKINSLYDENIIFLENYLIFKKYKGNIVDDMYDDTFSLLDQQLKIKKNLYKDKLYSHIVLKEIWQEDYKEIVNYDLEETHKKINKYELQIRKFKKFSQFAIEEQIKFLKFQILLIDKIILKKLW